MSSHSGSSSRYHFSGQKAIIHSRGSSIDSRSSYDSKSSGGGQHRPSEKTTMGYHDDPRTTKHRVADNDRGYVTTVTRKNVEVHNQEKGVYVPAELRTKHSSSTYTRTTSSKKHREHKSTWS